MKTAQTLALLLCVLATTQAQNPLQALRSKLMSRSTMTVKQSHMPLTLDNEGELREAQAALFNVNSVSGWVLLNYVGPFTVHFAAGGEGGVEELSQLLEDDQIQYGVVRLGNIQEKGTLKTTVRDVFFTWIGPAVGIIEKGKKTAFLGDAQAYLQPYHADVTIINKANLNRDNVLDKSHPLSGSHVID